MKAVNLLLLGMVILNCTFWITLHSYHFFCSACSTMYWDDRYGTETVSHEVLGRMKQLMVDKVNQSLAVLNVTVIQYVFFSLTIIHCIRPEASL